MRGNIDVSIIQAAQWEAYRDIRLHALQDSPDAFGTTWEQARTLTDPEWRARLERVTPALDHPMLARLEGRNAGLAWARIEPTDLAVAFLYQMWVAPESRGRGVGRALMDAAIGWAEARDARLLKLDVTCGDRPARRLYDALGFQPVGEPVPMRPGSDLMEQPMALSLGEPPRVV